MHAAKTRAEAGLHRHRRLVGAPDRHLRVTVDQRTLINFSSNDYLGLAAEARSVEWARSGASASMLISGYQPVHRDLEAALAEFTGFAAVCLFPSGYQANVALGQALHRPGDTALADRLNHASLNDGLRLGGTRMVRYAHADATDAARRLRADTAWIVSDSVFSMDGDLAPLADLARLADDQACGLWLDDAHGFGVLGAHGRGALEAAGMDCARVDAYVATFGKALGTAGAFVAGERGLIEHLENHARGLIYSTGLAPSTASATTTALRRVVAAANRRKRLGEHIEQFGQRCRSHGIGVYPSTTPIQIVPVGDNQRAVHLSRLLEHDGLLVQAIRPPTVPAGTSRLRISLSSAHRPADIDLLCDRLADALAAPTKSAECTR